MIIKQNSNVITIRLIKQYINERIKHLEKSWQDTYNDPKQFAEHCICIGRLHEIEEFKKMLKDIAEINEDY